MIQPNLSVSKHKPFNVKGMWCAQAHVEPNYLVTGLGVNEDQAKRSLDQEIKDLERQLKERKDGH